MSGSLPGPLQGPLPGSRAARLSAGRELLERCLACECDIDPMILRARMLRHHGALIHARCLEQELMPLF